MIRKFLVGAVCLLLLALLDPLDFYPWLIDTLFGIAISAMFLTPLVNYITGERRHYLPVTLGIGFVLFVFYFFVFNNADLRATVIFVLQWMVTVLLISGAFMIVFREYREFMMKFFED